MSQDLERRIAHLYQRNDRLRRQLDERRRTSRALRIKAEQSAARAELAEHTIRNQRIELDNLRNRMRNLRW